MRILILEDDPLLALDLQGIVEGCGHEVSWLCCTLAAMKAALGDRPDFAFLDIDLPDGKSFELATRLAERSIPFAFLSASRPSEVPEHLRSARFIPKPYGQGAIRTTLTSGQRLAS